MQNGEVSLHFADDVLFTNKLSGIYMYLLILRNVKTVGISPAERPD